MTRTVRSAAVATLAALAAIAAIIAADFTAPASAQSDDLMLDSPGEEQQQPSGRIVARRLRDGRTELGWQQRTNGVWGERILPRARYMTSTFPRAEFGSWSHTSPVEVEGVEIGRIEARKRRDRGIELAFTPTNGERFLPSSNYFPADSTPADGWRPTSAIPIDPTPFIAARFAPVLHFEQDEDYFPVPVELMIQNSTLHYTQNGQPRTKAPGAYSLSDLISHNGLDSYLDLADDAYKFPGERVVYARVAETYGANAGVLVQYWFFYLYNATGTGSVSIPLIGRPIDLDHEGDWEGVQLWFAGLSPADLLTANLPTQIGYAAHESGWAFRQNAESCAATNGRLAPSVYVARNRHASYIGADGGGFVRNRLGLSSTDLDKSVDKQDQFQGNGATWALRGLDVPDVENEQGYKIRMLPTDLNQSWLAWTGRWGDAESGSGGPLGPAFKSHFWLPPVRNGWSQAEFECRDR